MIVRRDYIDKFFKQDTFTNVDLDNLRHIVENRGYNNNERKSAMSLIEMHLAAYAIGTSLNKPMEEKKRLPKLKKIRKKKNAQSKKAPTIQGLSKKNQRKYNKLSKSKKLSLRLKNVLKKINTNKSLKYAKQKATSNKAKTKQQQSKKVENSNKVLDKWTLAINEMLKKRGINKETVKNERFQKYRVSKNTYVKIIYTRM